MAGSVEQVQNEAVRVLKLKSSANGIKAKKLVEKVQGKYPDTPIATVRTVVSELPTRTPSDVYRSERGMYRHVTYRDKAVTEKAATKKPLPEKKFYELFADWLKEGPEACTNAQGVGGRVFGSKWMTPDVMGITEPRKADVFQVPVEVVSAEIKTSTADLVAAFGQACAYKLFSHKVYLVIPKTLGESDESRLDSLCLLLGIGLVLFDATNEAEPNWEIKTRPMRQDPDTFYLNQIGKKLSDIGLLQ